MQDTTHRFEADGETTAPPAQRRATAPNRAARRKQSHGFRAAVASINAAKRTGAVEPGSAGASYLAAQRKQAREAVTERQEAAQAG